jgi:hypothetical protein
MHAATQPLPGRRPAANPVVRTRSLAGIEAVFDPGVHLVVWERRDAAVRRRARAWPTAVGRAMHTVAAQRADAAQLAERLGLEAAPALAADVAMLCDLFETITGATTLGLRLDVTDRATCPVFHVDRVTLRLMTTYRGPGTEWLEDGVARQARAGDVLFAKGETWPQLAAGPCQHRSPRPRPGETRVLLTLDAL